MPQGKYRIMTFKEFVPDPIRFIILLITAIIFQFTSFVYLTNLNDVVGGKAITTEDVKLISSVSFIGMTMVFPILFRIKFRFMSRTIILSAAAILIVANLISIYSNNLLVLLIAAFIAGAVRMVGTFECLSTIQLIITPKRDFTVFFSVVYLIVLGSIQVSGLLTAEMSDFYDWTYMPTMMITLLLVVMIVLYILMRPIRLMKKFPLYQIDWLGLALWSLVLIIFNFVFEYGKRLDWFDSPYICIGVITGTVLLICAIQRMLGIRRPVIMPEVFKYKNLLKSLVLLAFLQIFLSTGNVVMNAYTGGILHYDILHNTSLNWAVFVGVLIGAAYAFYWMSIYRGGYKPIFFIGFGSLVLYHFILYFIFQPALSKEYLYLPYALKGFGYVSLYISIALYAAQGIPFPHFFASLSVLGFVRTALGGTMANSLCTNVLQYLQKKNLANLTMDIDFMNPASSQVYSSVLHKSLISGQTIEQAQAAATSALYGASNMQALLLSWKEIFGGVTLLGILFLLGIASAHYMKPVYQQFPKMKNIWKYMWGKAYSER